MRISAGNLRFTEASPPPIGAQPVGEREWTCPATINHQIAAQRARGESPRPALTSLTTPDVARNALVGSVPLDRRAGVVPRSRRETSAPLGHQRITFRPRPRRAAHPPFAPSLSRFDPKAMVKITTSECAPRRAPTRLKGRPTRSSPLAVAVISEPMSPSAAPRREAPRFHLPDPLTVPRPIPPSLQSAASAPATSAARPWP